MDTPEKQLIQVTPFQFESPPVFVDWDYALNLITDGFIKRKASINCLAEYGAIAYECTSVAETNSRLAIVICDSSVWFCPSRDGLNGVFIEPYRPERHGQGIEYKKQTLLECTNFQARLDGWDFFAQITSWANQGN